MISLSPDRYELAADIQTVLLSAEEIEQRILALGQAVSEDYAGRNPLLIGVLKGVMLFISDLLRAITIPAEVDFMAISSYTSGSRGHGGARIEKDVSVPITGRHVLFVEDVVDTGLTLNYLLRNLRAREPASLEVCTLFDKSHHRLVPVPVRYKGFDLPDAFVVGYGLDYRERYRNLPFVGLLAAGILSGESPQGRGNGQAAAAKTPRKSRSPE